MFLLLSLTFFNDKISIRVPKMWPEEPYIDGPKPWEKEKAYKVVSFGCLTSLRRQEIISITRCYRWRGKSFLSIHFSEDSLKIGIGQIIAWFVEVPFLYTQCVLMGLYVVNIFEIKQKRSITLTLLTR